MISLGKKALWEESPEGLTTFRNWEESPEGLSTFRNWEESHF